MTAESGRGTPAGASYVDDVRFDVQLRDAAQTLVVDVISPSDLAMAEGSITTTRRGVQSLTGAVVGLVAITLLVGGRLLLTTGSTSGSTLLVDGVVLVVTADSSGVHLTMQQEPAPPMLVGEAATDAGKIVVRQLVCELDAALGRHVILFGYRGGPSAGSPSLSLLQLGPTRSVQSDDGSFLFIADAVPPPGAEWVLASADGDLARGHVAVFGVRQTTGSGGPGQCVVYDPAVEQLKP